MNSEDGFRFPFEKLDVWHKAKDLVMEVYRVTSGYPDKERFGLISQMNRAALSIASNIAEGSSRSSKKEQAHFTEIAYGSLMEVTCQLIILIVSKLSAHNCGKGTVISSPRKRERNLFTVMRFLLTAFVEMTGMVYLVHTIMRPLISRELAYLSCAELENLRHKTNEISRMLTSLRAYQKGG